MIVDSTPQPLVLRIVNFFSQAMWKGSKIDCPMFLHLLQSIISIPTYRSISRRTNLCQNNIWTYIIQKIEIISNYLLMTKLLPYLKSLYFLFFAIFLIFWNAFHNFNIIPQCFDEMLNIINTIETTACNKKRKEPIKCSVTMTHKKLRIN